MSGGIGKSVCVVGAGVMGLITIKNLAEEGFDVVGYERHPYIGGLWHATEDTTQASVLAGTFSNGSKWMSCYSDMPQAKDFPAYMPAKDMDQYLQDYAQKFDIQKHIKLSTKILKVERHDTRRKWIVESVAVDASGNPNSTPEVKEFDRIVFATGRNDKVIEPNIKGSSAFEGEIIHSHLFRDPAKYKGKTVVVVGSHATAADIQEFCLDAGAKKVYLSHRRAFRLLPRVLPDGKPLDTILSRRMLRMGATVKAISPSLGNTLAEQQLRKIRNDTWPELANHPIFDGSRDFPDLEVGNPCISESLAQNLIHNKVQSVRPIKRITGPRSVELEDGQELDHVDAIICCTGSEFNFESLLPADYCPTNPLLAPGDFEKLEQTKYWRDDLVVCRAYRQMLSLQEPHSLAFFGHALLVQSSLPLWDLVSMALAQLWKGAYPIPSSAEMQHEVDTHFNWIVSKLQKGPVGVTSFLDYSDCLLWLHKVAGTGLPEKLDGWGWEAWKFWWYEGDKYKMLVDGINSPHALRLFETGRRKAWPEALKEIEKANKEVEEGAEERKKLARGHPSGEFVHK